MKTAISLADSLYRRAEQFAQSQRLSRSELYARALEEFLERHEGQTVTAQLNAVYAGEDSSLPPALAELGFEVLSRRDAE